MSRPKVFVTQFDPKWNFTPAEEYGEVVFLTSSEYQCEPSPVEYNAAIHAEITRKLQDYVPGRDYIALTGSGVPNFVAGRILGRSGGPHRILKWSNRQRAYELFTI